MLSTSQARAEWGPPCRVSLYMYQFYGGAIVPLRREIAPAVQALNTCFAVWGYPCKRGQTWGYACRQITGGVGYSLHAYGIAPDCNSLSNPYGSRLVTDMPRSMTTAITSIRTNSGAQVWGWGGNYSRVKDAMHFEIVCTEYDLRTGIDWSTVPRRKTVPVPAPPAPARRSGFLADLTEEEQREALAILRQLKGKVSHADLLGTETHRIVKNNIDYPSTTPGAERHPLRVVVRWCLTAINDTKARVAKIEEKVGA